VRVVVADDAVILREGVGRLLEEVGFEVAGLAADADELQALVERTMPDVVNCRHPDAPDAHDEGCERPPRARVDGEHRPRRGPAAAHAARAEVQATSGSSGPSSTIQS
jgi:DNA-binding NarL/FixJ family response regulator